MCPSSGEITVFMRRLVLVTQTVHLFQSDKYQVSHRYTYFSWWWAHSRPKHVEKRNKHTKKNCAPSWIYLQDYKKVNHVNAEQYSKWVTENIIFHYTVVLVVVMWKPYWYRNGQEHVNSTQINDFRCGIPSSEPYRIRKCNFIEQLRTPTEMSPSILVSLNTNVAARIKQNRHICRCEANASTSQISVITMYINNTNSQRVNFTVQIYRILAMVHNIWNHSLFGLRP